MLRAILYICILSNITVVHAGNCDIFGENYSSLSNSSEDVCFETCKSSTQCKGAVFISSWNKCFLKSIVKRRVQLTMYSKIMETKGPAKKNMDSTGKDMKNIVTSTVNGCEQACRNLVGCASYTYMDGYSSCWLKSAPAKLIEKNFSCYVK